MLPQTPGILGIYKCICLTACVCVYTRVHIWLQAPLPLSRHPVDTPEDDSLYTQVFCTDYPSSLKVRAG